MNINEFIKRVNETSPVFSDKRMTELNKSLITRDKKITTGNFQFAVIIEEYCELLEAIAGIYTAKDFSKLNNVQQYSIIEELADAFIVTNQLQILFGYSVLTDFGEIISRDNFDKMVILPISRVVQILTKKLRGYEEYNVERLLDDVSKIHLNIVKLVATYEIRSTTFFKAVNVKVNRGIERLREAVEPEFQNDVDTKEEKHLCSYEFRPVSSDQAATECAIALEYFMKRFLEKK